MVPATNRLRRGTDFRAVVRSGQRIGGPRLVVTITVPKDTARHDHGPARVGFSVGRQVGSAVVRNAVRRKLRHLMRDRLDLLPAGATAVVRALPAAASATTERLEGDLDHAFARLGVQA